MSYPSSANLTRHKRSLYKCKSLFVAEAMDLARFNRLAADLVPCLVGPALTWPLFVSSSRILLASSLCFVYDRRIKVVLPVTYGQHSLPSALLYAYHTGEAIPIQSEAKVAQFAEQYIESGMGSTYAPGRGLLYGGCYPLTKAEKQVFHTVKTTPVHRSETYSALTRD